MSVLDLIKDPAETKDGLKTISYGGHSTKKTLLGLTFPKLLAIDSEKGMSFYKTKSIGKNIVKIADTRSYYDLIDLLEYAAENHEELGIESVLVDSVTKFKNNMEEVILTIDERRAREDGKDENEASLSQRSYGRIKHINDKINNLMLDLSSKGINVHFIAQAKDVKKKIKGQFETVGQEPNAQKKIEHEFDIVLYHFTKEIKGETTYWAKVEKDRTHTFKKGEEIQDPHFDLWKDAVVSDGLIDDTNFAKQTEEVKARYETESNHSEMSLQDRVVQLVQSLDTETKKEFQAALKKAGITKFDGLTVKKQNDLKDIVDSFSA